MRLYYLTILMSILVLSRNSFSSTFVGNGGSDLDYDFQVTLYHIKEIGRSILDDEDTYCKADED